MTFGPCLAAYLRTQQRWRIQDRPSEMDVDAYLALLSQSITMAQVFIVPRRGAQGAGGPKVLGSASWEFTVPLKQGVKKQRTERSHSSSLTFPTSSGSDRYSPGYAARGLA